MPTQQSGSDTLQKLSIPFSIVIAGGLIAGALYFSGGTGGSAPIGGELLPVDIEDIAIDSHNPVLGDANAPVTLAYWFDYQCPFCKAVDVGGVSGIPIEPALPMLVEEYVNTGKLKIVFKDYAFLGENSTTASLYKNAVWALYPDKFYEWHEAMFHALDSENQSFGSEATVLALTRTIPGLDAERLRQDVATNRDRYLGFMEADRAEGASFGIQGTPGFITGTTLIPGADEPAAFKAAIDAQL